MVNISTQEEIWCHLLYMLVSIHNAYICVALDTCCENYKTTFKKVMRYHKSAVVRAYCYA